MIEINFFERKKKNYSPLILVAIFIVGLLVIGAYVLIMNSNLQSQYQDNISKINQQQSLVSELKLNQILSKQVNELTNKYEQLDKNQYPTPFLYETIRDLLPQSDGLYLYDYTFSIDGGLTLSVQLTGLDQVTELTRNLTELAFVTSVDLQTVDLVNQNESLYIANIKIGIDRDQLSEVTQND